MFCYFGSGQLSYASSTVIWDTIDSHAALITDTILVESDVYIRDGASLTIEKGTTEDKIHFEDGGALYIWEFPKVIIDSCTFLPWMIIVLSINGPYSI